MLVGYIQAQLDSLRWIYDSANKAEATALLAARLKLPPDVAAQTFAIATDPTTGFAKEAAIDMAGFANVLKLRAEIEGQWGGTPPASEKYLDRAIASARLQVSEKVARTKSPTLVCDVKRPVVQEAAAGSANGSAMP